MHADADADAEVDMSAVGRVGSICRAAEDGAPDPDRRADLAHSMRCARGKSLAQPPRRRFTWQLVAFRYERGRQLSTSAPPHAAAVRRRRCVANAGSIVTGASTPYMSGVAGSHARGMSDTATKWRQRVAGWRASGEPRRPAETYSTGQAFKASSLRYWASRLRREDTIAGPVVRLAQVVLCCLGVKVTLDE